MVMTWLSVLLLACSWLRGPSFPSYGEGARAIMDALQVGRYQGDDEDLLLVGAGSIPSTAA